VETGATEGREKTVMERHHPAFFEHARVVIEPVLDRLGFSLAEEHYHQRSFGSAIAVYTRRGGELRLIWDGREGTLSVDYDSRVLLEKRIDWLGPSIKTAEELSTMAHELVAKFGGHSLSKE
jgi:hypothetical protein